jgi:broad specificity phosphatase PhoE
MPPSRPFFFLRHGETDWNLEGRIQGQRDIPLNATGLAQARAAAQLLPPGHIDRVIASPLRRALDTAQAVAARYGIPLHRDEGLQERGFGSFEGRLIDELKAEHSVPADRSLRRVMPADSERWDALQARVMTAVERWLDRHADEALLFVSHAGPFSALHERLVGMRRKTANATLYRFACSGGEWSVGEAVALDAPEQVAAASAGLGAPGRGPP